MKEYAKRGVRERARMVSICPGDHMFIQFCCDVLGCYWNPNFRSSIGLRGD